MKASAKHPRMGIMMTLILFLLVLYVLALFIVLGWGIMKSLQDPVDYVMQGATAASIPKKITFVNYINAFGQLKKKLSPAMGGRTVYFDEMLLNSLIYGLGCAFMTTAATVVMAYATSRVRTWFNKVINGIFFFTLFVPIIGSMPSMIQVMTTLRLMNTWTGAFVMKINFVGTFYLIYQGIFGSLSREYAEAAKIDGAGRFRIMLGIELPLVKTMLIIAFVTSFIGFWNDYQTPMVYLPDRPTAAYGLWLLNSAIDSYHDYVIFKVAGFMILMIPTLVLFLVFKNKMMGNLTAGGLKG